MANNSALINYITSVIRSNGNQEITGDILQGVLLNIVNRLGYQFAGIATPTTVPPSSPDANIWYLASAAGTYTNFNGVTLDGNTLVAFLWDGDWSSYTLLISGTGGGGTSEVTAEWVTTQISNALFPYATKSWVTEQGYLTSFTSGDIIAALGYTPLPNTTNYALGDAVGGNAINANKLGGNLPSYYAAASVVSALATRVGTVEGNITTLNGRVTSIEDILADWFDFDAENRKLYLKKDANGNVRHFISYGDIIAGGDSEGGETPTTSIDWSALAAATTEQINITHLTDALSNYVTTSTLSSTLSGYLPLSGGVMANNAGIGWSYNIHSWDNPVDGFEAISTTNDNLGYYSGISYKGYYGLQIRSYGGGDLYQVRRYNSTTWGAWLTLIHSGNIGSQSVSYATSAGDADTLDGKHNGEITAAYFNPKLLTRANTLDSVSDGVWFYVNGDNPTNSVGDNSALLQISSRLWDRFQIAFPGNDSGSMYFRASRYASASSYSWCSWKTIAFTDSNVASAQNLTHSNGTIALTALSNGWLQDGYGNQIYTNSTTYQAFGSPSATITTVLEGGKMIVLKTGGGDRVLVSSDGNVGIGTTSPSYKLDVAGSLRATSRIYANEWIQIEGTKGLYFPSTGFNTPGYIVPNDISTYGGFAVYGQKTDYHGIHIGNTIAGITLMHTGAYGGLYRESAGKWLFFANSDNEITIGNANVSSTGYQLWISGSMYVAGNTIATGEITAGSDIRYKSIQNDVILDTRAIANAPIFDFRWTDRDDDKLHLGTSAQYWLDYTPNAVTNGNDFYSLNYGVLGVAIGVSNAKKLLSHEEKLTLCENRIEQLENENKQLRNELNQLRYGIE